MKWFRRVITALVIVGLVGLVASGGFLAWTRLSRYPAILNAAAPSATPVVAQDGWHVYAPNQPATRGFIFYPGGLVDVAAYDWLGPPLAERCILTVIMPMPLELAILNPGEAEKVVRAYPNIHAWAVGGHSLGGVTAAQFLASHAQDTLGAHALVLWGARLSAGIDVSKEPLTVVSIYGTRDGIAPSGLTDADRLLGLPPTTKLIAIEGGDHSMFGDYGLQKGDNPLTIPLDQARKQIVDATAAVFAQ